MVSEKEATYYIEGLLVKCKLDRDYVLSPFDNQILQIINHKFPKTVRTLLSGGTPMHTQPPSKRKGLDYYDNRRQHQNRMPSLQRDEVDGTIDI